MEVTNTKSLIGQWPKQLQNILTTKLTESDKTFGCPAHSPQQTLELFMRKLFFK